MINLLLVSGIILLFLVMAKAADAVVYNCRVLAEKIGLPIFFLGLLLGIFANLPEIAIGVNAFVGDVPEMAFGNLIGGIIVVLCLVLGTGLILNAGIKTDGRTLSILPITAFLLLPLVLGLRGKLDAAAGLFIILSFFAVIIYLYRKNHYIAGHKIAFVRERQTARQMFIIALGMTGVIVISSVIVRLARFFLDRHEISPFFVGLFLFAIGTNLPEIMVMLRSWRRKVSELSLSALFGSAMTHVLILGVFVFLKPVATVIDASYLTLLLFMAVMLSAVFIFYRSGRLLTRAEGYVLVLLYLVFAASQLYFAEL